MNASTTTLDTARTASGTEARWMTWITWITWVAVLTPLPYALSRMLWAAASRSGSTVRACARSSNHRVGGPSTSRAGPADLLIPIAILATFNYSTILGFLR